MKIKLLTFLFLACSIGVIYAQESLESNQRPSGGREKRIAFIQHERLLQNSPYKDIQWKPIQPGKMSGRCTDVRGVPGNKNIIFAGFASGGLWRTKDAGKTWQPLFDKEATLSIGNIGISPSDPNIIYVGTGEANIYRASLPGIGVLKSSDGGDTWYQVGLENTATIARIAVHPTNPDIVYVAAGGNEWSRNEDRGVYKSTDGGLNWKKVLYTDDKTGANDLVMDPTDPNTIYVSMWTRIRKRWSDPVPEDGDHIYKSTDGGENWKIIENGLPETKITGRIGLAVTAANPNVIYAFIDNHGKKRDPKPGELDPYGRVKQFVIYGAEVYKSTDKGDSWKLMSMHDDFMENFSGTYGWVFSQIRVSPADENKVYLMGLDLTASNDGGKSWKSIARGGKGEWHVHGDHHAMWIDPTDAQYIINGNDGGVNVSFDGGVTWKDFYHEIPTTQFYNVTADSRNPFYVYGSIQDEGSVRMLSNSNYNPGDRNTGAFDWVPGGEGTRIVIDRNDQNTIYSSSFYGKIMKGNLKKLKKKSKKRSVSINPPAAVVGEEPRGEWLAATSQSPHDGTLYHGFQYVLKTTDKGKTWQKLSDDLTQNDKNKIGIVPYRINYQCITAISESPKTPGLIYAGTDDGKVHFTSLEGKGKWTDISDGLLKDAAVSCIEPSHFEAATVYVSLSDRREDNLTPLIYKSQDYGNTWTNITQGLPASPVNVIKEDLSEKDVLYAGTDMGIFISKDGGKSWNILNGNLPASISIQDLMIHPKTKQIIIATYGRGVWITDALKHE